MTWTDYVVNAKAIESYYQEVPDLTDVRLRSVNLDGWDSAVILRLDLPRFPDRWDGTPGDTMQCQIQFLMVQDFLMEGWQSSVTANVTLHELPEHRLAVQVTAPGAAMSFTSNASLKVGRISAFERDTDGGDSGLQHFTRPLETKRYPTIPPPYVSTFFKRV
ncbi:Imm50 family immunity protein [Streptomyces sp. NPDC092307]|uniref:Imm50 family immunity protein n=1 Tax=Streptomyces sp. NPDC092307 TaxID=3366013 RepID=UPI00382D53DC